jgi:hypothetical protein
MGGGMTLYGRKDQLISWKRTCFDFCGACKFNFDLPAFAPYGILLANPDIAHLARQQSSLWAPTRWAGPGCSWHWADQLPGARVDEHQLYIEKYKLSSGERGGEVDRGMIVKAREDSISWDRSDGKQDTMT